MNTLSVTDAVRHFSDYINRVTYRHESFVLCKGKKPVAELRPLPKGRRLGDLPAIFNSIPRLDSKEIKTFSKDIEKARKSLDIQKIKDPWES